MCRYLQHPFGDDFSHVRLQFGLDTVEIGRREDVPFFRTEQVVQDAFVFQQNGIGVGATFEIDASLATEQILHDGRQFEKLQKICPSLFF